MTTAHLAGVLRKHLERGEVAGASDELARGRITEFVGVDELEEVDADPTRADQATCTWLPEARPQDCEMARRLYEMQAI